MFQGEANAQYAEDIAKEMEPTVMEKM